MHAYTESLNNEESTLAFGQRLARATFAEPASTAVAKSGSGHPSLGALITLKGELGAGKTTLTRGILRGYGYEGAVKSPTYTLVEPYEFDQCHIYHFDLYRLADPDEFEFLGIEDYFQPDNLCIVEWPERAENFLPQADIELQLSGTGESRELEARPITIKGRQMVERLWP